MSRIPEKTKVAILEKILESKKILFDENMSKNDILVEWNKISKIAKKLGYNKTPNYLKSTFMYNQKTSAGRRLLVNAPLTQAQKLTIEILGKNKIMGNIIHTSQETDADASDEDSSDDDEQEVVASVKTMNIDDNNNTSNSLLNDKGSMKRIMKRKSYDSTLDHKEDETMDKENQRELTKLKKRKLMLEIEHMELEIKRAKFNNLVAIPDIAKNDVEKELMTGDNKGMEEDENELKTYFV